MNGKAELEQLLGRVDKAIHEALPSYAGGDPTWHSAAMFSTRRATDAEAALEQLLDHVDEAVYEARRGHAAQVNRSSSAYIRWVQSSLNRILGSRLRVDGIIGDQARSAIRSFQQRQGLVADGIVGTQTQAELIAAGAPPPPAIPGVVPGGIHGVIAPPRPSMRPFVVLDHFEFDRSSLTPLHLLMISRIASQVVATWRTSQPIDAIRLVGYTDSSGPAQYNLALGQRRALAVQQALISTIDRLRPGLTRRINFVPQSLGEARPVAPSSTSAGRARNRRVEAFLAQRVRRRPMRPRPGPPRPRPLDIIIDSPRPNDAFFIEPGIIDPEIGPPTTEPLMPSVTVLGRVLSNGQPVENAQISWQFKISGQYRVRSPGNRCGTVNDCRLQRYVFDFGRAVTNSGQRDRVSLGQLRPGLIVGGTLEITATFQDSSRRQVRKRVQCRVLGRNPRRENVVEMIRTLGRNGPCGDDSWALIRIFCHESGHALRQFTPNGAVLFGPPAGVGITQRDPEEEEWKFPRNRITQPNNFFPRIFWNWQENVIEGVRFFRTQKLRAAMNDLRALQRRAQTGGLQLPDPCIGVVMRAAIRRYNGGTEYRFRRRGRTAVYVVSPRTSPGREGYVNQVLGDHGHPTIALPAIPNNARHALAQEFGAGDLPCEGCPLD